MNLLVEIAIDCPDCGEMMLVKIAKTAQVGDLFKACPVCKVLATPVKSL